MKKICILFVLLLTSTISYSQNTENEKKTVLEKYYQNGFAIIMHGQKEVVLNDLTRVDIVTDTFAIEVDFAKKWAESIGQSIYYALELNKKPGILLIVDGNKDDRYVRRLMNVAIKCNITVWLMDINSDDWCKVNVVTEYSYNFK